MNDPKDFWKKVKKVSGPDSCWPWTGSISNEYGMLRWKGKSEHAQRVAFLLSKGEIPKDQPHILHTCDNPPCCRPKHLFAGTHQQNMLDKEVKGRGNHARGDNHWSRKYPEKLVRGDRHPARMHPETRQGIKNGRTKLTPKDVRKIRKLYPKFSSTALGKMFGISQTNALDIAKRLAWKSVT